MTNEQQDKKARLWRIFNGSRALIWVIIIPVSYYFNWIASIRFVSVCSLYANAASDVASWRSDVNPSQAQLDRIERKLDELLQAGGG